MRHQSSIKITILIGLVILLSACSLRYEYTRVSATIIHKEFEDGYYETVNTTDYQGNPTTKQEYVPAEWDITVDYNGIQAEFEFTDIEYWNNHQIGQTMKVYLRSGYDEDDKLVTQSLELFKD
ncbi:hypothetical protein B1748_17940 [Paenibacillus sp. MY03]|uniref:hypothetical protein n=1 Tax=Paenibacillus sp. MY03 TaxID=302980 RepID=UPI000B3BEDC2|nr:hypothetical protein [Paenibacillus sp. MY03]OUS75359.1 hypothetical protein B1748_17940 [Paenibacillus sp. MY03]